MLPVALAVFAAVMLWWASTGVILYLDRRGPRTYKWSMAAASLLLGLALYGLTHYRDDASVLGAYLSFVCALTVWAWLEMSFLLGYVTGPRRRACAPGCHGWSHFGHAIQAILYHELALVALTALVFALDWPGTHHTALWTMLVLWLMRESAKLNLFLGVRNLNDELLPEHLLYLRGFFRKQSMNFLFPVSVTACAIVLTLLVQQLFAPGASDAVLTSAALLATLTALGLIEHWALVLPFPATALWGSSVRSREAAG
jgi:putative photosynthetic complex assembly protein 2